MKTRPASAVSVRGKTKPAAPSAPPKTLQEAATRIQNKLRGKADVRADPGEDRVLVRFTAKDKAAVEAGLKSLGVKKYNTGIRDAYSWGGKDIAVSPYQTGVLA